MSDWPRCPVCEGAAQEEFVAFAELAFVRCCGCGTVFKRFERPGLRRADFYERGYFHGRRSGRDKRFAHRVRKATQWLRSALELSPTARSVLDVGCSFGYVIEAGNRLGLKAAGADVSQYAVEICQGRGLEARVGTLERLPYGDGEFDVVVMKHVLEHTPTPAAALAEARRVLGPKGVLLIAVPNLGYWKGLWRRRTYRYFRPDDLGQQHYVYYTARSLARLLERAGLCPVVRSKAFYRRRLAASAFWRRLWEPVRFALLWLAMAAARPGLQRELFFIAQKT